MIFMDSIEIPSSSIKPVVSLNPSTASFELQFQRPSSPWLELSADAPKGSVEPCHFQLINQREKIHRIRPLRSFPAEITHIVSPSEIWVRLLNHIADKLTISTNNAPNLETNIVEGIYVFTPLNENILVRARVLFNDCKKKQTLLRLIDHGKLVWRDENAIFEMKSKKDEMRKYPWQAIPITLQGVIPKNGIEWHDLEIEALKTALSDLPRHYILPTCHEMLYINNDNDYIRASIHAMTETEFQYVLNNISAVEEIGHSVFDLYEAYTCELFPNTEPLMDYFQQKRYRYSNELSDTFDLEYQSFKIVSNPLPEPKNQFEDEENIPSKSETQTGQNEEDCIDIEQWDDIDDIVTL
uniref:Tudor domain-containing protein n=1 Tax=Panagrolaimus sp. PS1159 TaxID=55785 RepID=A0AC35FQ71_9BILA